MEYEILAKYMRAELEKVEAQCEKLRAEKAVVESKFLSTGDTEYRFLNPTVLMHAAQAHSKRTFTNCKTKKGTFGPK